MNGHCSTCDVEQQCGYKYKPCECCNYRKFTPINQQPKPAAAEREARAASAKAKGKEGGAG